MDFLGILKVRLCQVASGFLQVGRFGAGEMVERCLKMLGVSALAHYVILTEM